MHDVVPLSVAHLHSDPWPWRRRWISNWTGVEKSSQLELLYSLDGSTIALIAGLCVREREIMPPKKGDKPTPPAKTAIDKTFGLVRENTDLHPTRN